MIVDLKLLLMILIKFVCIGIHL